MRLVLMGTGTFAEPAFSGLLAAGHDVPCLVTQPGKEKQSNARGSTRQTGEGMEALAARHGVPVWRPVSINAPESVERLEAFAADLLVVAAYGQILKPEVLGAAKLGGINLHASLLPRHRGAAPVAWAIASGDTETGVSVIRMTPALDAGEVIGVGKTPIGPDETAGALEARLALIAADLAVESVGNLASGTVRGILQDQSLVTRAPKLNKLMGDLDWEKDAPFLARWVRAMQPWPTAYTTLHRQGQPPLRLLVAGAEALPSGGGGAPGEIQRPPADLAHLPVCCSHGVLALKVVQPAGKGAMTAAAFLRGRPWAQGDRMARGG
ncbi:MAG: methionyl-tRNA formyltransferase [Planctomycetes bacterium]|nr:methionyl-tRNA formyltransferase [Planctomycetota bacterium]